MDASSRVVINTVAQYVRTIIGMVLGLYSTRLILQLLGVDDYGIYSLVGGVVSMLSFVIAALSGSTQRYLSYYQGSKNAHDVANVFNNCVILHIIMGTIMSVVLLCITPLLFNGFLNIAPDRLNVARFIYIIVIINLFISVNTAPYQALITAHENIVYSSLVSVLESVIKLVLVVLLKYVPFDKLAGYGIIMLIIQLFGFLSMFIFDRIKYQECKHFNFKTIDASFIKEFASFTGWTMYNAGCNVGRTQGVAILINKFLGTAVNAAYGLAQSVQGYVLVVSSALHNAISPQIMKSEGGGNHNRMLWLCSIESKMSYLLLLAVCVPIMFEINPLLELWLGDVPEYAGLLCCMKLATILADSSTIGLSTANLATGKLKDFSLYVYSIKLLTIPLALIGLLVKKSVLFVVFSYVIVEFVGSFVRIPFMKKNAGLVVREFIKRVYARVIIPTLICVATSWLVTYCLDFKFRFLVTIPIVFLLTAVATYLWGLMPDEKEIVTSVMQRIFRTKRNKSV